MIRGAWSTQLDEYNPGRHGISPTSIKIVKRVI